MIRTLKTVLWVISLMTTDNKVSYIRRCVDEIRESK